ncbi:MAG: MotA/TolQ/ExbB proton channel family protein, partial [Planctomycetaceae bacterium]|nr:MotA/TolQ/ExbB proton channel family protein [Planctomycetaceae bacterium]
ADLEYRLVWVATIIKTAPMLGLFGTVVGMMGAFAKLASSQKVEASNLANDISVALITTFDGLAIAIPLIICVSSVNVRMRKMEDLVGAGLTRFFDSLKPLLEKSWQETT